MGAASAPRTPSSMHPRDSRSIAQETCTSPTPTTIASRCMRQPPRHATLPTEVALRGNLVRSYIADFHGRMWSGMQTAMCGHYMSSLGLELRRVIPRDVAGMPYDLDRARDEPRGTQAGGGGPLQSHRRHLRQRPSLLQVLWREDGNRSHD